MKRLTTMAVLIMLFQVTFVSAAAMPLALGKDVNVPEGVKIFYWSGGSMNVSSPATFHWPYPQSIIGITASRNEGGNAGTGDTLVLVLYIWVTSQNKYVQFPWALITTNPSAIQNQKTVFSGTPIYIQKTVGGTVMTLDNTFLVTEEELKVQRHGNGVTIEFDPASTITLKFPSTPLWPTPNVLYPLVLPKFNIELSKYGGSMHTTASRTFTSTPPLILSGYTFNTDQMGFAADGTFTCQAWSSTSQTSNTAFVTMHGINTFAPPQT